MWSLVELILRRVVCYYVFMLVDKGDFISNLESLINYVFYIKICKLGFL